MQIKEQLQDLDIHLHKANLPNVQIAMIYSS